MTETLHRISVLYFRHNPNFRDHCWQLASPVTCRDAESIVTGAAVKAVGGMVHSSAAADR
jgi:hypothetical protein